MGLKGRECGVGGRLFLELASDLGKWSCESDWRLAPLEGATATYRIVKTPNS